MVNVGRVEDRMVSLKSISSSASVSKSLNRIMPFVGAMAFVEQLTEKDRQNLWSSSVPMETKVSQTINIIAGRTMGISVIPGVVSPPRTFKPHQFLTNKYVGFFVMGEILGLVGEALTGTGISKYTNMYRRITRTASIPGAVGAVFDDIKPRGKSNYSPTSTRATSSDYASKYEASFLEANR